MENFNEETKKTAVETYGHLHKGGKNEAEIKGAIAEDSNGFTKEQIDAIYQAIIGQDPKDSKANTVSNTATETTDEKSKVKKGGFVVIQEFRDKDNFDKVFEKGDDVSHFDADRLKKLVENKVVEKVK